MVFEVMAPDNEQEIKEMSEMATEILRDYYDPIIGKAQNDYMLDMFQSADAIRNQLDHGYRYFFVRDDDRKDLRFFAFYPRGNALYLSKFYLYKDQRGKGYARPILEFLKAQAKELDRNRIELNVNRNNDTRFIYEKLGFTVAREEKNDIGNGFYMDDYVYAIDF